MTIESSNKNIGVLYGLINAGAAIVFTVILYLCGAKTFVSPVAYIGRCIPLVICVLGGLQYRKQLGGYMEFSEALKITFQILVIGSLGATIFQFVLFNYIDVPFRQAVAQASIPSVERFLRWLGMPDEQIDKAVEETLNENNYTIGRLLMGFVLGCIGLFIVSLIVSVFIKRKRPPFENTFNQ